LGIPALRKLTCKFCSKTVEKNVPKEQQFCSPQCATESRKQTSPEKAASLKMDFPPGDPKEIAADYLHKSGRLQLDNARLKSENDFLRDQLTKGGMLYDALKEGVKSLPVVKSLSAPKPRRNPAHVEESVLLFSDLHAAATVSKLETDGFNEYDFNIFCRRMQALQNAIVDITDIHRQAFQLNKLNVFSLGDIISGDIHFELEKTNDMPLITSAIQTATVIAQFLLKMAGVYDEIKFFGVTGNHGRKTREKGFKHRYDSIELIIYSMLPLLTANQPNISYIIPQSPWLLVNIFDWVYLLTHGDQKSNSFAGIPYYGLGRLTNEFQGMYRKRGGFDLACYGHYHTPAEIENYLVNGSMVGTDEFAIQAVRKVTPPSQKFFGVSSKRLRTFNYDIELADAPLEHDFIYNPSKLPHDLMMNWTKHAVNMKFTPHANR
jgi:hypothetical protein